MATTAKRRLLKDFQKIQKEDDDGIIATPAEDNLLHWEAFITGPDDTIWEGGTFKLSIQFTEEYPNKPPTVKFISKMFHPNIYNDGSLCLDILQNQWSPIYDVSAILTSIRSLLSDPNPASPANAQASQIFNENRKEYEKRVKQIVQLSWES